MVVCEWVLAVSSVTLDSQEANNTRSMKWKEISTTCAEEVVNTCGMWLMCFIWLLL